jgi:tRNA-uridine 2-sulfurtransferase
MDRNIIYVSNDSCDDLLMSDHFRIKDVHWINGSPEPDQTYQVLTRYNGPYIDCTLHQDKNGWQIRMSRRERAITPGQSAVIYAGDQVVGGGIVESAEITNSHAQKQKSLVSIPRQD